MNAILPHDDTDPDFEPCGDIGRALAAGELAPVAPPVKLAKAARRALAAFLRDEMEFSQSTHHDCPGTEPDGTCHDCEAVHRSVVQYEARKLQLHIDALVAELTGQPMPAGTVRSWLAENPDDPEYYSLVFPDLPPVGGA